MTQRNSLNSWFWLVVAASLCAAPVAAQAPKAVCDPESPQNCAAPLRKGQSAPFDGQLLTDSLALSLGQKADGCAERITIEKKRAQRWAEIGVTLAQRKAEIDRNAAADQIGLLRKRLGEAQEPPPWYETSTFTVVVTVVITTAVMSGAYILAVQNVKANTP